MLSGPRGLATILPAAVAVIGVAQGIAGLMVADRAVALALRMIGVFDLLVAWFLRRSGQRRLAFVEDHIRNGPEVVARVVEDVLVRAGVRRLDLSYQAGGQDRRVQVAVGDQLRLLESTVDGARAIHLLVHPKDARRVIPVPAGPP